MADRALASEAAHILGLLRQSNDQASSLRHFCCLFVLVLAAGCASTPRDRESALPAAAAEPPLNEGLTEDTATGSAAPESGLGNFALMIVFGFLGGLILNITPCVLPVVSIKVLSFVQQAGEAVAESDLPHELHEQDVVVHRDGGLFVDAGELMLRRCHLIVSRLHRNAQQNRLPLEVVHEGEDAVLYHPEVVVLQLLPFGGRHVNN